MEEGAQCNVLVPLTRGGEGCQHLQHGAHSAEHTHRSVALARAQAQCTTAPHPAQVRAAAWECHNRIRHCWRLADQ